MVELKEINMGSNMVMLKANKVTSSILPKNTAELDQNITVDGDVMFEGACIRKILDNNGPANSKELG